MAVEARYPLGRLLNHDPRSRAFPAPQVAAVRPILWRTYGRVLDQGDVGACTGFAAAACLNTAKARKSADKVNGNQDGLAIYHDATQVDPFPGAWPPDDTGSDANSVAKALRNAGRISTWSHVFNGGQGVVQALMLGPVLLGINWHQAMFTPDKNGVIRPDGNVVGGHEMLLRGYNGTHVIGRNSWGPSWGLAGGFLLSVADLDTLLYDSGDATVLHR